MSQPSPMPGQPDENEAVLDSSGSFTLDLRAARDKQAGRLFPTRHHWVLRAVQVAHQVEATAVHLNLQFRTTQLRLLVPVLTSEQHKLAHTRLAEAIASLPSDDQATMNFQSGEIVLSVTRSWRHALGRLSELRLLTQRCLFATVPISIDGRVWQPKLPAPYHSPWFDLLSFGSPQWLGELRCGRWPVQLRPQPVVATRTSHHSIASLLALSASLEGKNLCAPVQHGVMLEPVPLGVPDVGALVAWNAGASRTDLSGFRLLEDADLGKAPDRLRAQLLTLVSHLQQQLPRTATRLRSRDAVSLAQFLGLVGGIAGGVFGGPGLGVLGAGATYQAVVRVTPTDPGLAEQWQTRLEQLARNLRRPSPTAPRRRRANLRRDTNS